VDGVGVVVLVVVVVVLLLLLIIGFWRIFDINTRDLQRWKPFHIALLG